MARKRYLSRPKGGFSNLLRTAAAVLLCFTLLAAKGGGDGALVNLPGGGGVAVEEAISARIQVVGGYALVQTAEGQPVTAYQVATGLPIGTMPTWPTSGETTITSGPWTCSCHNIPHTISTKISTRHMKSDMEKHDKKLNAELRRHPPQ